MFCLIGLGLSRLFAQADSVFVSIFSHGMGGLVDVIDLDILIEFVVERSIGVVEQRIEDFAVRLA